MTEREEEEEEGEVELPSVDHGRRTNEGRDKNLWIIKETFIDFLEEFGHSEEHFCIVIGKIC